MTSHKLAIVTAGAAVLFVYHEVKLALIDAHSSPLLSKLISPLTGLDSKLSSLRLRLHGGQLDPSGIKANTAVTSIGAQSGAPIRELVTAIH